MSRTTLCVLTAAGLAAAALGVMALRYHVLGPEVNVPAGPGTWKITLLAQGISEGDARLQTARPLDFGRQHVLREQYRSAELIDRPPDPRHPDRRQVLWSRRAGVTDGPFRARCEFYCVTDVHRPTASMAKLARSLYAPPRPGEHLDVDSKAGTDNEHISSLARRLTAGREGLADQAAALFRYVDQELSNEPSIRGRSASAVECLRNNGGDSRAKSRLLAALLRNRGIPARLVTGLALLRGREQQAHYWVEAWLDGRWLPMCPTNHHYGRVPSSYLVFGFGDVPPVRGRHVRDLEYAFLVERVAAEDRHAADPSPLRRLLLMLSFHMLPPAEQRLVEFLLLLPVAALIVCVFRNVIGLYSFGTFAPALLGLAFREVHSLPGILVFVAILLIGWVMRRLLDHYHLLQVPRMAFLLSLVVLVLIVAIVAANYQDLPATRYIALFPMVILTGMIERFWTLEVEDSTAASFRTLLSTILIAACIALLLSLPVVASHLFRYPETLGLIMAGQLLLGRYTGYRLTELFRFREFLRESADPQTA
ncbi:MAG TPA: 7TM domain-containing protein [Gemmataceae bacterium]|nr:7TM domain-containing protein [Gemmataceae bacterium]